MYSETVELLMLIRTLDASKCERLIQLVESFMTSRDSHLSELERVESLLESAEIIEKIGLASRYDWLKERLYYYEQQFWSRVKELSSQI